MLAHLPMLPFQSSVRVIKFQSDQTFSVIKCVTQHNLASVIMCVSIALIILVSE